MTRGDIIGAGLVTLGLFMAIRAFIDWRRGIDSHKWPSTTGLIVESQIRKYFVPRIGSTSYSANVTYQYKVGREKHTSKRVYFGARFKEEGSALDLTYRYEDGRKVPVYYDPDKPQLSVLEPGTEPANAYRFMWGLLAMSAGVALIVGLV
jgi:hypothetical protein